MNRALILVVCMVVLAGCGGSDGERDQDDGGATPTSASPSPTPEPPSKTIVTERLNETLRFPRGGQGQPDEAAFEIAEPAFNVSFRHQRQLECPAGYADDPVLVVTPPNGTEFRLRVMPQGSDGQTTVYPCPAEGLPPGPWINETADADAGSWNVRTENECTCTVHLVVLSHEEQ